MKRILLVLLILVLVAAGFWAGLIFGKQKGKSEKARELEPLVNFAFPKPADEIFSLTGKVKGIYGATIYLEIDDLDDYLAAASGREPKKETRYANVTSQTEYTLIDTNQLDENGNFLIQSFKLSDLKEGDIITVRSSANIRSAKKFDIVTVEVVK